MAKQSDFIRREDLLPLVKLLKFVVYVVYGIFTFSLCVWIVVWLIIASVRLSDYVVTYLKGILF